jgi:hypothetical protein
MPSTILVTGVPSDMQIQYETFRFRIICERHTDIPKAKMLKVHTQQLFQRAGFKALIDDNKVLS